MKVLADSNFWIGLFNPLDESHLRSLVVSSKLHDLRASFLISNYIFSEVTSVMSLRAGRESGIAAGNYLMTQTNISIIHIDQVLHQGAWQIFQEIQQKDLGFVDCSILAVLRTEAVDALLTFDKLLAKLARKKRVKIWPVL